MNNNELEERLSLLVHEIKEKMTDEQLKELSGVVIRNINYRTAKGYLSILKQVSLQLNIISELESATEMKAKLKTLAASLDKQIAYIVNR